MGYVIYLQSHVTLMFQTISNVFLVFYVHTKNMKKKAFKKKIIYNRRGFILSRFVLALGLLI